MTTHTAINRLLQILFTLTLILTSDFAIPSSSNFALSNLNGTNGFTIEASAVGDVLIEGLTIGDINADGTSDLAVVARLADPGGRVNAGKVYVIFNPITTSGETFNLSSLNGTNGFVLHGIDPGDGEGGISVSPAGDVNNDGVDDLIIGARLAEPGSIERVGEVYIVFGKKTPFSSSIELSNLDGTNGFKLTGIDAFDDFGRGAAGVGDFNGDGIDDLVIGGALADPPDRFNGGESYIFFGHKDPFPATFGMASLNGTNGFIIRGETDNDVFGCFVDGAGDVNGDGLGDAIIGACQGSSVRSGRVGKAYIILGTRNLVPKVIELSSIIGTHAVRLQGVNLGGQLGIDVAGAGDINGDGFSDVIVGEPNFVGGAPSAAYVIFGTSGTMPATIKLSNLNGNNGFSIPGLSSNLGFVGSGGDVNRDGYDDILVGAPSINEVYLIFGKDTGFSPTFDTATIDGTNGVRFLGVLEGEAAGSGLAIVQDLNGDEANDLLIGAINESGEGTIYIVFSTNFSSDSCRATFKNSILGIPCVNVIISDSFEGTSIITYKVEMQHQLNSIPITFELTTAQQINEIPVDTNNCVATYKPDGFLNIPCVSVTDIFGDTVMYEADMELIPLSEPFSFKLIETQQKN